MLRSNDSLKTSIPFLQLAYIIMTVGKYEKAILKMTGSGKIDEDTDLYF